MGAAAREVFFPGFLPDVPGKSPASPLAAYRNDDERPATDEGE